jgi:hypothetical protein
MKLWDKAFLVQREFPIKGPIKGGSKSPNRKK